MVIVQSEMDVATAYEGASATGRYLLGARPTSVDNEGSRMATEYREALSRATSEDERAYFLRRFGWHEVVGRPHEFGDERVRVGDPDGYDHLARLDVVEGHGGQARA
ncbi:hypothetical protein AB0M54_45165 [Actinoplanes sp. NPDC051470]|uniref:hypothetical protein n=1 Tax=Actinoplanes sp. NPDC051470 TaxID=3157224 RepID=UPI00343F4AB1